MVTLLVFASALALLPESTTSLDKTARIGVIFDILDKGDRTMALQSAVEIVNRAFSRWRQPFLSYDLKNVFEGDSFQASEKICSLLQDSGAMALLGPLSPRSSINIQSFCNTLNVGHITLHKDFRLRKDDFSIIIQPHPRMIGKAIADFIKARDWYRQFTIIYADEEGLWRLQDVLQIENVQFTTFMLSHDLDFRPLLKKISASSYPRIILDCNLDQLKLFLEQAEEVNMINDQYDYIITNLDLHTVNLEMFENEEVNLTGFNMIDSSFPLYKEISNNRHLTRHHSSFSINQRKIPLEYALLVDSFVLFAHVFSGLNQTNSLLYSCDFKSIGYHSTAVIEGLLQADISGLTGPIRFNSDGFRTDFMLSVITLKKGKYEELASWNANQGLDFTELEDPNPDFEALFFQKLVKVVTIKNPPFIMETSPSERLADGKHYKGFVPDFVDALSQIIDFKYKIYLVSDGKYGDNKTGVWNGMIGEILEENATVAIGDLTITQIRQDAVDFTMPFMNFGIGILFKKPKKLAPPLFSFLAPFHIEIWICIITAFLGTSMGLYFLARMSTEEWTSPKPDAKELENQFNLLNCFWFSIGFLTEQGSEFVPKATSTRILGAFWGFFTLIIVSSYTANLTAFLTNSRRNLPINSATDLERQSKIRYGCVQGGSTQNFFSSSSSELYASLWKKMANDPSVFTANNNDGKKRVKRNSYAFFMESSVIEYMIERDCELISVGRPLGSKGYGIAMLKGSLWWNKFNSAVLKLQENGSLLQLKKKWWQRPPDEEKCEEEVVKTPLQKSQLHIENVGGVFIILVCGVVFGCIVGAFEFMWSVHKTSIEQPTAEFYDAPLSLALKEESKVALSLWKSKKPVCRSSTEMQVFNGFNRLDVIPQK